MTEMEWTPAEFEIAQSVVSFPVGQLTVPLNAWTTGTPVPPEKVAGMAWGPFGIHETTDSFRAGDWTVTHLPTGRLLVQTRTAEQARQFVAEIASLTDWTIVQAGTYPPGIKDAYLAAWRRAHGERVTGVLVLTNWPDHDAPVDGEVRR